MDEAAGGDWSPLIVKLEEESQPFPEGAFDKDDADFVPDTAKLRSRFYEISDKSSYAQDVPHECLAGLNISQDNNSFNSYPTFGLSYPRAIYIPRTLPNKLDPCHKRPRQYSSHQKNLQLYKAKWHSYHRKKRMVRNSEKKHCYPDLVFRFAEKLASNPDPYFSGTYDWYFTGGNINAIAGEDTVIHVEGTDLNTLVLSEISISGDMRKLQPKLMHLLGENEKNPEIFEIQSTPTSKGALLSIRQKYNISIYECNDYFNCKYYLSQKDVPYISSTFDPYKRSHFITTDLNKTVTLWDVRRSTKEPKQVLFNADISETEKDQNWNCICPFKRDTYAFAGLNDIFLLDTRVPFNRSSDIFGSLENAGENCAMFCSLCTSKYENIIYAGTTHKIYGFDMRYLGKEIDEGFAVLRWVHMMNYPPLILKMHRKEDYELIFASSPLSGDMVYLENIKNSDAKLTSPSLPFTPLSLEKAYENARRRGQCLNPNSRMKERIDRCTTGATFLQQNENFHLTFSNSNGDIFSQRISFEEAGVPASEIESSVAMSLWEDDILKFIENKKSVLDIHKVEDLSIMSKVFRCSRLNNAKSEVAEDIVRPRQRQTWRRPVSSLHKFTDALAEGILSIWDIQPEDEKLPAIKVKDQNESLKVMEWLNDSAPIPSAEENSEMPPMVCIPQTGLENVLGDEKSMVENIADTTRILIYENEMEDSKPKIKPKRERYVPGF